MAFNNSPPTWKCSGTKENPHPQVANHQQHCKFCGEPRPSLRSSRRDLKKGAIASVVAVSTLLISLIAYGLYQRVNPCAFHAQNQSNTCSPTNQASPNLFQNPDPLK